MRILFNFVFSLLLCTPLLAMDWDFVPQEPSSQTPPESPRGYMKKEIDVLQKPTTASLVKSLATLLPEQYNNVLTTKEYIHELKWNPQGTLLAVATGYRHPFIFNPDDNSVQEIPLEFLNLSDKPEHVAWNKSGRLLAIGTRDKTVSIFDVTKKCITRIMRDWYYSASPAVAWSPTEENTFAVCAGKRSPVQMYHIPEDPSEQITHSDPIPLTDAAYDISGYYGNQVRLEWRNDVIAVGYERGVGGMTTQDYKLQCFTGPEMLDFPMPIAVHPWKPIIAYAERAPEMKTIVALRNSGKEPWIKEEVLDAIYVGDLSFSHDGLFLTAVAHKGLLTMNAETLEILHTIPLRHNTFCESAQWNPTQHQLAYSVGENLFITGPRAMKPEKSNLLRPQSSCSSKLKDLIYLIEKREALQKPCTVSPVTNLIARPVHTTGEDEHVNELKWNPQGTLLAVAANYRHPFIFNPDDNSVQEIPLDSKNTCYWPEHVAWNKSGRLLAIGALNKTVSIFDVAKKCITRTMHEWNYEASPAVAWSPTAENTLAVCASKHSPVRMYHIPEDPSEPITHTDPIKLTDPAFDKSGYCGHPVRLEWRNGMIAMGYERGVCCMTTPDNQMRWTRYCENGTYPRPPLAVHPWKPIIAYAAPERWWNSATKKLERVVWRINLRNSEKPYEESFIKEKELLDDQYVTDLSFSHDGRFLTAVSDKGLLTMNADTLEILNTIPLSEKTPCEPAQWNPTQHQLAYSVGRKLFITDPITIEPEKNSLLRPQPSCSNLKDLMKK